MDKPEQEFLEATLPHLDTVYRVARHLGADRWSAEDLVQETYLRAFAGFSRHCGPSTRAWLVTICHNLARSEGRRRARRVVEHLAMLQDPDSAGPGNSDVNREVQARLDREVLARALSTLSEEQQLAIVLMDLAGHSASEVAQMLGVPRRSWPVFTGAIAGWPICWPHRGSTVTCPDEARLGALVAGELSAGEAAALDEHLLSCEECWRAVQEGRAGRLAVDRLREAAPPGLADRIVAAIELDIRQRETNVQAFSAAATPDGEATSAQGPEHRVALGLPETGRGPAAHRHRARLAVAAVLAAGGLAAGVVAAFVRTSPADPAQVAAVVAMARHPAASAAPPHHLVVARQEIDVRSYRVDGHLIVVATSARQFPMPSSSHVVQGSSQHAWMASSGSLGMYCVNHRPGQQSMLLVASMPAAELPQVAAGLHLI